MKTLIINGSPREKGDTASLLKELKRHLLGEVAEISAYNDNISPCNDCRYCYNAKECRIKDKMSLIYNDDYDNIVIASPIYMSALTPPVAAIASRLQLYYTAKYIQKEPIKLRPKKAALILCGGGDGAPNQALETSRIIFGVLNAGCYEENIVLSLNTDKLPAKDDKKALGKITEIAYRLNGGEL